MSLVDFDHKRYFELNDAVLRAQAAFATAELRLNIATLEQDAFRQEYEIRRELAQLPPDRRVPEYFSPTVFDALPARTIRFIVTGQ